MRRCLTVFDENGRFNPAFSDEEKIIPCDSVILAIGQQADLSFLSGEEGVQVTPRGILKIDENLMTTAPGVFAGGDVAFGPRILVEAVANGHKAARSIHVFLSGKTKKTVLSRFRILPNWEMPRGFLSTPRQTMPVLAANRRIGIAEVELGFDEEQGRAEGLRCLNCQVNTIFDGSKCILCAGCVDVCPENCLRLVDLVQVQRRRALRRADSEPLRSACRRAEGRPGGGHHQERRKVHSLRPLRPAVPDRGHHHGGSGAAGAGSL